MSRARGELERDVMGVLWNRDGPAPARTVLRELGDPDLAYATVKTVLERLTRKGAASRVNVDRTWHYSATRSRDAFVAELMLQALERSADRDASLVAFVRSVGPTDAAILRAALADPDAAD